MVVIITGPTASGKTALSEQLVPLLQGSVINADMGQFYTALTVGTAKPAWRTLPFTSYLFDWVDSPKDVSVVEFKKAVDQCVSIIHADDKTPIIVGGSSFYIKSLFYPPLEISFTQSVDMTSFEKLSAVDLWDQLFAVDPKRAQEIFPTDRYRLTRALALWHGTGQKPSTLKPPFVMPYKKILLVIVLPERATLVEQISSRATQMVQHEGWVDETKALRGTAWEAFVQNKKLVGYTELLTWIANGASQATLAEVINRINIKTRQYAKRQEIFLKKLAQDLEGDAGLVGAALQVLVVRETSLQTVKKITELAKGLK